ncbi:MAG: hypothetical protein ACK44D_07480, partial [Bacteroidia bacterium]
MTTATPGTNWGAITFNLRTTQEIRIDTIFVASDGTATTLELWYKPGGLNGQPTSAEFSGPNPSWFTAIAGQTVSGFAQNALIPLVIPNGLVIPANGLYGIYIGNTGFTNTGVRYASTVPNPDSVSNGVVSIRSGTGTGFGWVRTGTASNTPRAYVGGVSYRPNIKGENDASVSALISNSKFCGSTQDLVVKVANKGQNPITNVQVNWSIDGITQTPANLSTLLDTIGHPTNKSDTNITLGTVNYTPNVSQTINVWTSMPNGVADTTTANDSLRVILRPGLSGIYTLGTSNDDFATFTSAINTIDSFGKCGPLTFNVTSGIVLTQLPISIINQDSITFQKFGTGANPKVYGINGIGTADAVFKISGSKNIVFDGIDVSDTVLNAANTQRMEYGYAIINSSSTVGSSNNIIKNCRITLNRTNTATFGIIQSTTATAGGVAATSLLGGNHNNLYENVKIENAYKGIGLIGTAAYPDSNCVVTSTGGDTTIIGADSPNDIGNGTLLVYGINAADQKNVEISKCWVRNLTSTGTST